MRIGIDFHLAAGPYQGSRRYLLGIYREISRLDQANHYFYCYNRTQEAPLPDGITGTRVAYETDSGLRRLLIAVPRLSRRLQLDWFHFQHQAPPLAVPGTSGIDDSRYPVPDAPAVL